MNSYEMGTAINNVGASKLKEKAITRFGYIMILIVCVFMLMAFGIAWLIERYG
jgi:hypothetical protein